VSAFERNISAQEGLGHRHLPGFEPSDYRVLNGGMSVYAGGTARNTSHGGAERG
jgi:hypothetical protein